RRVPTRSPIAGRTASGCSPRSGGRAPATGGLGRATAALRTRRGGYRTRPARTGTAEGAAPHGTPWGCRRHREAPAPTPRWRDGRRCERVAGAMPFHSADGGTSARRDMGVTRAVDMVYLHVRACTTRRG